MGVRMSDGVKCLKCGRGELRFLQTCSDWFHNPDGVLYAAPVNYLQCEACGHIHLDHDEEAHGGVWQGVWAGLRSQVDEDGTRYCACGCGRVLAVENRLFMKAACAIRAALRHPVLGVAFKAEFERVLKELEPAQDKYPHVKAAKSWTVGGHGIH